MYQMHLLPDFIVVTAAAMLLFQNTDAEKETVMKRLSSLSFTMEVCLFPMWQTRYIMLIPYTIAFINHVSK